MADVYSIARRCAHDPAQNAHDCMLFEYLAMVAAIMPRFFDRTPLVVVPVGEAERPEPSPWVDVAIAAAQMQAVQTVFELREAQSEVRVPPLPEPALKARLEAAHEIRAGLDGAMSWVSDEIGALEKQLEAIDG